MLRVDSKMVEVLGDGQVATISKEEEKFAGHDEKAKHLLENRWTWWFFRNDRSKQWEDNQAEVARFQTVEDFWALYNHVENAGKLPPGCDYSVFKTGIKPAWEDERNREGGRWLMQVDRTHKADTDRYWMEILMMIVGEAFGPQNEYICGAVVNIRAKGDKIAVWVSCLATQPDDILKIGLLIKQRLELGPRVLTYQTHADTSCKCGSSAKTTFQL